MSDNGEPTQATNDFLAATAEQARQVLAADDGWPTYHEGIEFQSLAMNQMASADISQMTASDYPMGLYLIWGALTDEMDAPGRGSPEQDAAAVGHMKRAASEWLAVLGSPSDRASYCDRWVHEECGYER